MRVYKPTIDVFLGKSELVVLHFSGDVASLVEQSVFHHSQKINKLEDGSLELSLEVGLGVGLAYWLLSFGDRVKVKSPEKLKDIVFEIAQQITEQYKD